jgi:hypothetical protein
MSQPKLIESSDDVVRVLAVFEEAAHKTILRRDISYVVKTIEEVRNEFNNQHLGAVVRDWQMAFGRMGGDALAEMDRKGICLVDHYQHAAVDEFARFLVKKNNAYGDMPIRRWGELGTIIRIDSKVQRYIHLEQNPGVDNLGESRADTIRDIVGYCVLGYKLAIERKQGRVIPVK